MAHMQKELPGESPSHKYILPPGKRTRSKRVPPASCSAPVILLGESQDSVPTGIFRPLICLDPGERFRQIMPRNVIGCGALMPGLVGAGFAGV
jgi:hypothetical protein